MDRPSERPERVVQDCADDDAREYCWPPEWRFDRRDERVDDDAEREHADDRLAEDSSELLRPEQRDADAADRAKETGFGNRATHFIADERHDELEHTHHHHR